jgi:putative oxidoreductase
VATGEPLQRLFSMFPNGLPGAGLLLLRLVGGSLIIIRAVTAIATAPRPQNLILHSTALAAGLLLLVGLWTPVAGFLILLVELWAALSRSNCFDSCVLLASIGAALAALGPGARSVDARLYGRKRIDISES